jgi:hypothetical protein
MAGQNADLVPSGRHGQRDRERRKVYLRNHGAVGGNHQSLGGAGVSQSIRDAAGASHRNQLRNENHSRDAVDGNPRNRGGVDGIRHRGGRTYPRSLRACGRRCRAWRRSCGVDGIRLRPLRNAGHSRDAVDAIQRSRCRGETWVGHHPCGTCRQMMGGNRRKALSRRMDACLRGRRWACGRKDVLASRRLGLLPDLLVARTGRTGGDARICRASLRPMAWSSRAWRRD